MHETHRLSWDGAVDHYWHLSIARYAGVLDEQRRRAVVVDTEIQRAIAPEASDE